MRRDAGLFCFLEEDNILRGIDVITHRLAQSADNLVAVVLLASSLACYSAFAQTPGFSSLEIRASAPNTMPQMRARFGNGRYELRNATAVDLIRTAWGIGADSISGGPDWLDLNRYDLNRPRYSHAGDAHDHAAERFKRPFSAFGP
jgi:hypothetical protein